MGALLKEVERIRTIQKESECSQGEKGRYDEEVLTAFN